MQLIWVAGPTAKVVTLSITARTIGLAVAGLCAVMLCLGVLFHFIGLRIAVELSPSVAHAIGGVASVAEHERAQAQHRATLKALHQQLEAVQQKVTDLEQHRQELLALVGIRQTGIPKQKAERKGQGGPLKLLSLFSGGSSLEDELQDSAAQLKAAEADLQRLDRQWADDLQRLKSLPAALPLDGDYYQSSAFGIRADPLTGQASLHEGTDFVAARGTPVKVTGDGVVRRADFAADLGLLVEVEHAEGFVSRYAHLQRLLVKPGQSVKRGATIGLLGNTGRSTGAHLHYEIERQGRLVDPAKALTTLAWR